MTMEHEVDSKNRLVRNILPWLVAAAATVLYGATLNHWVSFNSLASVAKISGWTWQPTMSGPLYWLLTLPFRWLPVHLVPMALNLFSMVCAVLTLALLARSVMLLPHDRTQDQRVREKSRSSLLSIRAAWFPAVLAAVVCGLQLTFWEHATAGSSLATDLMAQPFGIRSEMLDLLLFAYVIRCLLEFRVSDRQWWLSRAAFVFGAGMTNNWALVGMLPLFLAALIWIKGLSFFNARFLGRTALWGVVGLLFFFLLPVVQSTADISHVPFWTGLKASLGLHKGSLGAVYSFFNSSKQEAVVLALTSVLPLLLIAIRWSSYFGDNSPMGVWISTFTFRVVHAVFLAICIWMALDPPFSPRNGAAQNLNLPCLTLSYLGALCVGYFSGFFLLVFGTYIAGNPRRPSSVGRLFYKCVSVAVWLLLPLVAVLMVSRNLPQIRLTNGPMLRQYAALQAQALPPQGALLVSDDPRRLVLLQSFLTQEHKDANYVFLHSGSLNQPEYHRYLRKKYGERWPVANMPKGARQLIPDSGVLQLMAVLVASNTVYYLHPSFGYYFEVLAQEPHGLVYKTVPAPTNTLIAPPLAANLAAANESFWAKEAEDAMKPVAAALAPERPAPGLIPFLTKAARLKKQQNRDAIILGKFYSRALDHWGVQAQRAGQYAKAGALFQRALDLNPNNPVAQVNFECNQNIQARRRPALPADQSVEDLFGVYRKWDQIVGENGPYDDPTYCYQQGLTFARGHLYRQAANQFDRARVLAPDQLDARLWLARMDILMGVPDEALAQMKEIRSQAERLNLNQTNAMDLLLVEASAHLTKKDVKGAEAAVRAAVDKYPGEQNLLITAARVYASYGELSNAVSCISTALAKRPDDPNLLFMAAQIYMGAKLYTNAASCINTALAKHPENDQAKESLLRLGTQVHMNAGQYSNAIALVDQQLKLNPNNPQALAFKGYGFLQLGVYDQAATLLTQAMDTETNNTPYLRATARLNRAVAYLRSDKLDQAQRDYEFLANTYSSYQAYYGLQEIAYRRKDTNSAIKYCQLYLTNAPADTDEAKLISARLKELQPGPR